MIKNLSKLLSSVALTLLVGHSVCLAQATAADEKSVSDKTSFQQHMSQPPAADIGTDVQSFSNLGAKVIKSFFYCIALLFGAYSLYRRFMPAPKQQAADEITILSRKVVSPKSSLVMVEVQGRRFLLAEGQEQVTLISDLTPEISFADLALGEGNMESMEVSVSEVRGRANARA